ncbi:MAG: type II secretion system protein GspL [Pseudomonadota bacterium]|nr:MAG: type II secretion system protein GspL [Pseudomonadota bacterium]
MARYLFVRLDPLVVGADTATASWVLVDGGRPQGDTASGTLDEAAAYAAGERTVVCVPGVEVLLTDVVLPGGNRQRMLRAVPWALEERLIDDPEEMHFALGARGKDGRVQVAVVERARMQHWLTLLAAAQLRPWALLVDAHCLPREDDTWSVLIEAQDSVVRTAAQGGFAVDSDSLVAVLAQSLKQTETLPASIGVYDCRAQQAGQLGALAAGPELRMEPCPAGATALLAQHADPVSGINLLQGEFSQREGVSKHLRPWYTAAAVFAAWVVLQLGFSVYRYIDLSAQAGALDSQMQTLFRKTFPDARNTKGAYAQMQSRLKALERGSGRGDSSVQELLANAGPVLSRTAGLQVQSIRYRDGGLDLELETKDLQSLDKLKQELVSKHGWDVDSQSTSRGDKVESRLKIRGAGA